MNAPRHVVLVKHALPTLEANVAPRLWRLSPEGELQSRRLANHLKKFQPCTLVTSREPKATRTAELVADELGIGVHLAEGLEEFDRPPLPLLSPSEHVRLNAQIFEDPAQTVLGSESAARALARFTAGLTAALVATPAAENLVVVTHGTVIALFVAASNAIDAFELWKRLRCPSFVVLSWPRFELVEVSEQVV